MSVGAEEGTDFVLLDRAVVPLPVRIDQLGLPLRYRFGPARDDHAAPTFVEQVIAADGRGLMPFAPTQLKWHRHVSGDIALSWIRRTRFSGVGWEQAEVPLNEANEAYRFEILAGTTPVRTVETSAASLLYTAAQQSSDFGSPPAEFTIRVAQTSETVGAGLALEALIHS
jgi:hypothetical protein